MHVEFWFDFSCPYAYLASLDIEALCARADVHLELCPMLLGGVFRGIGAGDGPMATLSPAKAAYNTRDMTRWAAIARAPFQLPARHPQRTVRALRLWLGLPRELRSPAMHALYAAYWVDAADVTDDNVLRRALTRAGLPPATIAAACAFADGEDAKAALHAQTDLAIAHGIFGAPAMRVVFDDGQEPLLLWGQDRLVMLAAILEGWAPSAPTSVTEVAPALRFAAPPTTLRHPPESLVFHFDFASPFAYLASTQIARYQAAWGVPVRWQPLLVGALFRDLGGPDVPLRSFPVAKQRYVGLELDRWARWWNTGLRFPRVFPQRSVAGLRTFLALEAQAPAFALPFAHALFKAVWQDDCDMGLDATLDHALRAAGLDDAAVADLRTARDHPDIKAALFAATAQARAAGVFGVPTLEARWGDHRELFWGQDRLDCVAAWDAVRQ